MPNPTITDPDPVPGDFSTDREADRRTEVSFVHNRVNASSTPIVWVRIGSQVFLVYDGTGFAALFAGGSSVVVATNAFTFTIIPAGGWWGEAEFFSADGYVSTVV